MEDLMYCIRLKHSEDMPLKRPRKNCAFKSGEECTWHPATLKYVQENNIPYNMNTKFKCVLDSHICAWCKKRFKEKKEFMKHKCPNITVCEFEVLPISENHAN